MEKLTRTKKYAELRHKMEIDREQDIASVELSHYANKLNNIDDAIIDKMEVNDNTQGARGRTVEFIMPKKETIIEDDTTSDIMKEYIGEVKQYNLDKGNLSETDTQANILKEIRTSNQIRPFGYINADDVNQKIEEKPIRSFDDTMEIPFVAANDINNTISMEIEKLLNENSVTAIPNNEEFLRNQIQQAHKINDSEEIDQKEYNKEESKQLDEISNYFESKMLNQTTLMDVEDLNKQNSDDEDEDYDDDDDYEDEKSSSRIINFLLVVFILIMLVVLGVIVYFILMNKGII